jgi:hypothetical protein
MKTCNACGLAKPHSEFHRAIDCEGGVAGTCKVCRNERNAAWTAANREKVNAAAARRRIEALRQYSTTDEPSCACCGEGVLAFLTIEHTKGGGNVHRRQTGGGGFYSWLRKNGYPEGFEVLCSNCNHGRRVTGGACPHDELARMLLAAGS